MYSTGDYVGAMFKINADDYSKMTFYAQQIALHGMIGAFVYDSNGNWNQAASVWRSHSDPGVTDLNQYTVDLSKLHGTVTILFQGGWGDSSGKPESETIFSDIQFHY